MNRRSSQSYTLDRVDDAGVPVVAPYRTSKSPTRRPDDHWLADYLTRIADNETGSALGFLDVDYDDALDPDHAHPLTAPTRMEVLA